MPSWPVTAVFLGSSVVDPAAAESPAAIKLLAGCVQQLGQAAQPQPLDMQDRCTCNACQLLQSFLAHPDQTQSLPLGRHMEAEHGIR